MNRFATVLIGLTALVATSAGAAEVDWAKVDQAIGRKGAGTANNLNWSAQVFS